MARALALLGVERQKPCAARETVTTRQKLLRLIHTVCLKGSTKIVHMHLALLSPELWPFLVGQNAQV
jgi:hypothetical protein